MRPQTYSAETIANLIRRHTVVTLEQMQRALDDGARRTVFRKLEQLDYRSSYSHCGRYYTLTELARFDVHGLWEVDGVRFSVHGSLAATAEALVPASCHYHTVDAEIIVQFRGAFRPFSSVGVRQCLA